MMQEYEICFSRALHQKLKKKIIGKIFVKITMNDEILVVIERDNEMQFKLFISDFTIKLINGLTSDYVAYEVLKEYKKFIIAKTNEKYFYQD